MDAPRPLYTIARWDTTFETFESKRLVRGASWVATPNKHDGRSYRRLVREKDGAALYGAWALTVQVASKMPIRGTLADADGPLDPEDLEDKTGISSRIFARLLELATGERIGWLLVERDPTAITRTLAEVHAALQAKSARPRSAPQTPADQRATGQSPAHPADSPAIPADARTSAGVPAVTRSYPQTPAPRGRAQADRTGQDRTDPPTVPPGNVCLDPLEETVAFICALFRREKKRLGHQAQHELAALADTLPLSDCDQALIRWFYELPHDDADIDLRSRYRDADRFAINLPAALERAREYARRHPDLWLAEEKKSAPPPAEPEGWRPWFAAAYPGHPVPAAFTALPESLRSQFHLREKNAA